MIAAIASFLIPGAGHTYLGRTRRFLVPFLAFVTVLVAFGLTGTMARVTGFFIVIAIAWAVVLFGIVDSFVLGLLHGRAEARASTRWLRVAGWSALIIAFGAAWLQLREPLLGYSTYRVPADSMAPALLTGDVVLANTRLPVDGPLAEGALVVVRLPTRGLYIRRLKGEISPGVYALANDSAWAMRDPELQDVARANVIAYVTGVLWSPRRGTIDPSLASRLDR